jgi:hypothetical protein
MPVSEEHGLGQLAQVLIHPVNLVRLPAINPFFMLSRHRPAPFLCVSFTVFTAAFTAALLPAVYFQFAFIVLYPGTLVDPAKALISFVGVSTVWITFVPQNT